MKRFSPYPSEIYVAQDYNYLNGRESYYEYYRYNGFVYDGCIEYIHWWKNGEGKWRCFKCYLEKGNNLYNAWLQYLKTGKTNGHYKFTCYNNSKQLKKVVYYGN